MNRCFRRLDWIVLVVDWAGGACQVPYLVNLHIERKSHIMPLELEMSMTEQMRNVALLASEQVVHTQDVLPLLDEPVAQVGSEESGAAGNKRALL
jgi:uncharacterized iron-regulated protein